MPDLHILCLEKDELALAYPLVRSALRIGLGQWLEFARGLIDGEGGVLGVRAEAECLYGVAIFRPLATLRHRRALCVELLVAIDLGRRQSVGEVLYRRLYEIARERACPSIVLTVSANTGGRAGPDWQKWGFVEATSVLVRELSAGDANDRRSTRPACHE